MKRLTLISMLSVAILSSLAPALADCDDDDWKKIARRNARQFNRYYGNPYVNQNFGVNPYFGIYNNQVMAPQNFNPNVYWTPGQWRRHRGMGARIANPYFYNNWR